jgi:hypothetical protein
MGLVFVTLILSFFPASLYFILKIGDFPNKSQRIIANSCFSVKNRE